MPYQRPTLTDLVARSRADLDGRLPGADSRLRRSVLDVLARVWSAALNALYGLIDWIWRQLFPDTAEGAQLRRWAAVWGVTPQAATKAGGSVTLTGTNGALALAGTVLQRSDGTVFTLDAAVAITGGSATVAVTASDAGIGGNTIGGSQLTFVSPVVGINATAMVGGAGIGGGADDELDGSLRARLLDRIRQPPHGGNRDDYWRWTREVPGVTRAWVYPLWMGAGTVGVTFVMDGRDDIIPLEADVDVVTAYLDQFRPVTAALTVFAPIPDPIPFVIKAVPPTPEVEAAIEAELVDLISREAEPGGVLLISHIREAISVAAGELDHEVISPAGNVAPDPGHLSTFGSITWAP